MMCKELQRILLAEDSELDAELTIEALEASKLANKVDWVKDGVEVMEYLRKEGQYKGRTSGFPMVILLDIKMPKKSGLEVLKEIREDSALKYIPIVILTSSKEERDLYEGYALGVNAYVVKPVNHTAFIDTIRELGLFWAVINETPLNESV